MKRIASTFIIVTLTLISCKETTVSPPEQYPLSVHLQTGFFSDSIVVEVDDKITFKGRVATIPDSGLARVLSLTVSEGSHKLSIRIPNNGIQTDTAFIQPTGPFYVAASYRRDQLKLIYTFSSSPFSYRQKQLVMREKLFFSSNSGGAQNIYMMNLDGTNVEQLTFYHEGEYRGPRISPDGRKLLYYRFDEQTLINGIFVKELNGLDPAVPLDYGYGCGFSPDGNKIVYAKHVFYIPSGNDAVFLYDLSSSSVTRITTDSTHNWYPSLSPDGSQIVFNSWRRIDVNDTLHLFHWDIMLMNSDGSNPHYLVRPRFSEHYADPAFSPDGQKVVYIHNGQQTSIRIVNVADTTSYNVVQVPWMSVWHPNFNPQANRIYFESGGGNSAELYSISTSGGAMQKITSNVSADTDPYVHAAWVYE